MKPIKSVLVVLLLMVTAVAYSQTFTVPKNYKLKKDEDYAKYEKDIIDCVNWLENTAIDKEANKRQDAKVFLLAWITGAPNVTITVHEYVTKFSDKNPELIVMFMGGWTKYVLEHPDDKSDVNASMAGIKSVIAFYEKNKDNMKKDKQVDELKKKLDNNTLEEWVKKEMEKK